jgi:predicted AAA+ superfamily ATPase
LENWICHEITAAMAYQEREEQLSYWRLASGIEVDFLLGEALIGIEVKSSTQVHDRHLAGLRALGEDQLGIRHRIVVCQEPRRRLTRDGIEILPVPRFLDSLWNGELFSVLD